MPFLDGGLGESLDELPERPDGDGRGSSQEGTRPDSGGLKNLDPSGDSAGSGSSDDATDTDT